MQTQLKIFADIGELLTLAGVAKKDARHVREEDLSILPDAVMLCRDGRLIWVGTRREFDASDILKRLDPRGAAERISLGGATVLPGFVECHTHTVFAGDRAEEFEWRQQGKSYQEIAAAGGGILSTVRATRQASFDELKSVAQRRTDVFVRQGVTTLETKSGYGLDLEGELKCLRVARALTGPRVVSTYLGAHAKAPEFDDLTAYLNFMIHDVLPRVAREKLADRVDIYIEKGFFDTDMARVYLNAARALGLPFTAHVEQFSDSGGAALALELGARSLDHAVFMSETAIDRAAGSATTVVLLPASDFYLKMRYPPARALIDRGARVALSTDFNPGTSPTQSLGFVGVLARIEMKMSLSEVIAAYTVGAAGALGLATETGSLEMGKLCDFVALDGSWRELFYTVGAPSIKSVYKSGEALPMN
jgi:imidazolonepropionase